MESDGRTNRGKIKHVMTAPAHTAAAAVSASEIEFRALLEQAAVGVTKTGIATGKYVFVNQHFADIVGYTPEELVTMSFHDITPPTDLAADLGNEQLLIAGTLHDYTMEKRYVRKDGTLIWVNLTVSPLWMPGEVPWYEIGIEEDITERRHAEKLLRESEEQFRLLFQNLPAGFALHEIIRDAQGRPCDYRFLEVNPAYEELTGLKGADIVGKTALQVLPDLEPDWIERCGQVALGSGPVRFERFAKPLGRYFQVSAYSPMPGQFATVVLDITERKKMEEELRESEEYLRAIFDQAGVGVALLNTKTGQYVRINKRYCDFLGYTMEEMLQKTFMEVTFPDDLQQNIDANAQLTDGSRSEFSYEKRYVRKDGGIVWGSLTISPLWKPGEKPATYLHVAVVEDITERKKAEQERLFLQEQLLGSRKLEAVGKLAGGVAHNFNNLLTGIMGSIEIARMDIPLASPAAESLKNAQAAAVKAAGLARKLLAFARSAMIVPAAQHANDLVESALDLIASSLPTSLEIVHDLSPDAWDILADPTQMTRVLLELIGNAREATDDSGVITVRTRNTTVADSFVTTHPYARTGDFVIISVADTGPGIDPAIMDHLFEPFATTKQAGRGMGLAMVFGSIKQEGGWVDVSSDHGAGTEVSLYLPRHVEQPTPPLRSPLGSGGKEGNKW